MFNLMSISFQNIFNTLKETQYTLAFPFHVHILPASENN